MSGARSELVVVVPVAHRPDLEGDQSDQQRAESDGGRQPSMAARDEQGGNDEGVGGEQEADEDRPDCRPAGQSRSARRLVAVSRPRVTRTCIRVPITRAR
jgi:hypothetical protein